MSSREPVKDETTELPVPEVWRPTIEEVVRRFVAGDFELTEGVPGVDPISAEAAEQARTSVRDYGSSLVPLNAETFVYVP